jgi:hypothetical protein
MSDLTNVYTDNGARHEVIEPATVAADAFLAWITDHGLTIKTDDDVSFGPRDDDKMPRSWADRGLTWLKAERPQVFAQMMLAIVAVNANVTGGGKGSK